MLWRINKTASMVVVLVFASAALTAGCESTEDIHVDDELIAAPLGTISIYQLAGRLDMAVESSSSISARLEGPANTVMLFADPGGQIFVNGKAVEQAGAIVPVAGMLFLPEELVEPITESLRPRPADADGNSDVPAGPALGLVVLDPGHGGKDPGTTKFRINEKTINLSVALKAAQLLRQAGQEVVLTRAEDRFIELNERAAMANQAGAVLFVSIHADSCPDKSIGGFTVYVAREPSAKSVSAAKLILRKLTRAGAKSRGVKRANFRVLVKTTCPAVLVELGYLSNKFEAVKLADDAYQDALAAGVAEAVTQYLTGGP